MGILQGMFVTSSKNNLGIGKVIDIVDDQAIVEYFYSVASRIKKNLPLGSIKEVKLQYQTRCYIWSDRLDKYMMGRIVGSSGDEYEVALPDKDYLYVNATDIYVRCNEVMEDPVEVLALKGQETAFFHRHRSNFVRTFIKQRSTARGMTGMVSSKIRLLGHQVEVVRRILEDPIQRYLLSDEVGLGKTIEAGMIIRQYLQDYPLGRVLIVTPPFLEDQWQKELREKFIIDEFDDRVDIVGTDGLCNKGDGQSYGLLVLDEAHQIAAYAFSSDSKKKSLYKKFCSMAHSSDKVLLLSATPVLNNEQDFLAMLHILDPDHYQLKNLREFREKVQKRQEIGRLLLSLKEGANPFVLKRTVPRLKELFPYDSRILGYSDQLIHCLNSEEKDNSLMDRLIRSMRIHITETYRLHRRMLRNRRDSVKEVLVGRYQEAGPSKQLTLEYELDERAEKIHDLLDEWRNGALNFIRRVEHELQGKLEEQMGSLFHLLVHCAGSDLNLLAEVITYRLEGKIRGNLRDEIGSLYEKLIRAVPLFEGETELLQILLDVLQNSSEEGDRVKLLEQVLNSIQMRHLKEPLPKCVVFTTFTKTCKSIIKHLYQALGEDHVAGYFHGVPPGLAEEEVQHFRTDPQCFVLVCDRSGEEGRNLQFADILIHYDLPWSPNRLEQRIGRLDRIGRERPLRSFIFTGPDCENSIYDAWYRVLNEGLGIFRTSIASLQFYVEAKLPQLNGLAFREGAKGLLQSIPSFKEEIHAEQVKISEQNALDEIDALEKSAQEFFNSLVEHEEKYEEIQQSSEAWLCDALRFSKKTDHKNKLVSYKPTPQTMVPLDRLLKFVTNDQPGTYCRQRAVTLPQSRLFRVGEKFIETIEDYIQWDDRGKAFAIWRLEKNWSKTPGNEWFGFRFDYVIEADTLSAEEVLAQGDLRRLDPKALKRRADAFFPPLFISIFLDGDMKLVEDEQLLQILKRPFERKKDYGSDYNLTKHRLGMIDELVDPGLWPGFCREARETAGDILRSLPYLQEECEKRARITAREYDNRLEQLALRQGYDKVGNKTKEDLELERQLADALIQGIRNPNIRLDSVGFIVVSGYDPF
ncbi:hypothetical protein JCM14036_12360 [Desulfotomaculum defluvii]